MKVAAETAMSPKEEKASDAETSEEKEKYASFVLRPPVNPDEVIKVETKIKSTFTAAALILSQTKNNVTSLLRSNLLTYSIEDFEESSKSKQTRDDLSRAEREKNLKSISEAVIRGKPRKYQITLLEKAKSENTIVNLGTGQGKTLIAILCIKHFSSAYSEGKQTLFLVPSIALAVQHTTTLRANLPFKVATACHASSNSRHTREELRDANIVVATHGAAMDLLKHYQDAFSLSRVNLMVVDECHYATGNHGYARIMSMFYHRLGKEERPRVLGLTASPLVNVKPKCTAEQLESALGALERVMDSQLACFSLAGLLEMGITSKLAEERVVQYNNEPPSTPFPDHKHVQNLHTSRIKELKQLIGLYDDFGSRVTGHYCQTLVREIARNRFEKESLEQYQVMINHLKFIVQFCEHQNTITPDDGRSEKLVILETLLRQLIIDNDTVGVVFVERRITALALHNYLRAKWKDREGTLNDDHTPTIRCDMIVRQSTQVFKYLHPSHRLDVNGHHDNADEQEEWLHRMKKVRDVLDGLRRKETNVLIATSVVEEGVDVEACSFVIVLDHIKTSKGYVQMKGRARQKNAKFFVFENVHPKAPPPIMTLQAAQEVEFRVNRFIELRESNVPEFFKTHRPKLYSGPSASHEIRALHEGEYRGPFGYVDIQSAKSLLNRYSLSIPMDATSRSSREAMLLHMPIYDGYQLTLPAHLPSGVRSVVLPPEFRDVTKREMHNMLAMMACVRLYSFNLLNDRLLPLKRKDMHDKLLSVALRKLPSAKRKILMVTPPSSKGETRRMHLYALEQSGKRFDQHSEVVCVNKRKLAIMALIPLTDIPNLNFYHNEFDELECRIIKRREVNIALDQWDICTAFYVAIMDARWKKRTGGLSFRYRHETVRDGVLQPYVIVTLAANGEIDWDRMRTVIKDQNATTEQRKKLVMDCKDNTNAPRLWRPIYDPNATYICFGPSNLTCEAPFPYHDGEFPTYVDYMKRKYEYDVKPTCPLFLCQRLWLLPRKMRRRRCPCVFTVGESESSNTDKKRKADQMSNNDNELKEGEMEPLEGLVAALLPQEACVEAPLSDAALFLHCVTLPQVMYHIDRCVSAKSFLDHCAARLPKLASYLDKMQFEDILEVLTAKSCSMTISYDRLEYLGDAVLKLVQTDALLRSKDLKKWVSFLHEGDLSTLRSAMGSNERLKNAAVSLELHTFILTRPLGRGQWVPVGMEMHEENETDGTTKVSTKADDEFTPSDKVCADVMEAILGMVYIHNGYEASMEVAEELGISLPTEETDSSENHQQCPLTPQPASLKMAESIVGYTKFSRSDLVVEAMTHPSCIHEDVPCYQRLEWIGDAVLCLAAREWVCTTYPQLKVAELVVLETTLVCNETLAYLGCSKGLQRFINHRDPSLPSRFLSFEDAIHHRGLWGTDPPKVLPDIVEALMGAVHVDGGFESGQKAALFVLEPVFKAIAKQLHSKDKLVTKAKAREMMHPKQVVHELVGRYLTTRSMREEDFAFKYKDVPVWRNGCWTPPNQNSNGIVGQVLCLGLHFVAVVESSANIAKNRACAIAVALFHRSPELLELVKTLSDQLRAHFKGQEGEKEDEIEDCGLEEEA